jgi:hypothetical protein
MAGPGDGCHAISPAPNGAPRCSPRWPSPTAPGPPHPAPLAPRGSEARWRPARPCAESNREAVVLLLGGLLTAPAEAPPSVPRAPRHLARLPSSFRPFRGRTFRPCSPRAPNGLNRCLLLSWSFSVDLRGLSRVGSTEAPPSERASVCDPVGRRRIGHTGSLSAPPPRWGEAGDLRLTGPARRRATSSSRRGPARGGPGRVLTALTWRPEELRAGPTWSPQGRAAGPAVHRRPSEPRVRVLGCAGLGLHGRTRFLRATGRPRATVGRPLACGSRRGPVCQPGGTDLRLHREVPANGVHPPRTPLRGARRGICREGFVRSPLCTPSGADRADWI